MKILSIDTSCDRGSVALLNADEIAAEFSGDDGETYSSRLFRWLESASNLLDGGFDVLDAVGIVVGPGSFTGLRIGVAAAKGIALACGCPLVPLSTLKIMSLAAGSEPGMPPLRRPLLLAGRGEVYTALYRVEEGTAALLGAEKVIKPERIGPENGSDRVLYFGNGASLCQARLAEFGPERAEIRDFQPTLAAAAAREAAARFESGAAVEPARLKLNYIRLSDAERSRDST